MNDTRGARHRKSILMMIFDNSTSALVVHFPMKGDCTMTTINKADVSSYVVTGEFEIAATVSADAESKTAKVSKTVHLHFLMDNTPLSEVIGAALRDKRITWQSGARAKYESIVNGSTVKVAFKGGQLPVSPEEAMVSKLQRMTAEERTTYLAELMAKASK